MYLPSSACLLQLHNLVDSSHRRVRELIEAIVKFLSQAGLSDSFLS